MVVTCSVCGKEYSIPPSHFDRVKNPTCSRKCNGINRGKVWKEYGKLGHLSWTDEYKQRRSADFLREKNPAWKGGVTYFKKHGNYKGVVYVKCPEEFIAMARKDGYVMEHRLVVAKLIGRPLMRREVVHHVDHSPSNNAPENLMLFATNRDHKIYEGGGSVEPIWQWN